jgi:hypothetical protein
MKLKMSKLKSGWRRVKFGDVVKLSKSRSQDPLADGIERYVGLEHLEPGDLRIRSWGNVADGVTFTSVFQQTGVREQFTLIYRTFPAGCESTALLPNGVSRITRRGDNANLLLLYVSPDRLPDLNPPDSHFRDVARCIPSTQNMVVGNLHSIPVGGDLGDN